MDQPLHPNLARIAAAYDEIFTRYANNQVTAAAAHREIASLVARDDEGVLWRIDPTNGKWLRTTLSGTLVPDTPPSYGLATPTPYDVSPSKGFNPDVQVDRHLVDNELLYSPSRFAGSTRVPHQSIPAPRTGLWAWLMTRLRRR